MAEAWDGLAGAWDGLAHAAATFATLLAIPIAFLN
jgi:hypothetical protein